MKFIHCCSDLPETENRIVRSHRAWERFRDDNGWLFAHCLRVRSSAQLGGKMDMPYLRDILNCAQAVAGLEDFVVVTSDDCIPIQGLANSVFYYASRCACFSSRKVDVQSETQIPPGAMPESSFVSRGPGRSLYAFNVGWLRNHLLALPDVLKGARLEEDPVVDLIRKENGSRWTPQNRMDNLPECELPIGLLFHVSHEAAWLEAGDDAPENRYNRTVFLDWFLQNFRTQDLGLMKEFAP